MEYYFDRFSFGGRAAGIPEEGCELSIDMDLERFISQINNPKGEGVAQYIVKVDWFGYDR